MYPLDGLEAIPDFDWPSGKIDWIVVGGESGPGARLFRVDWARSIRDACQSAGVAFFMKQLGARPVDGRIGIDGPASHAVTLDLVDSHGGNWDEWPADLRVREFPKVS
jgi:protein gp37